ncbi:hypothetical protein ADUPG1_009909, partial [Aduncisulcus paluster]
MQNILKRGVRESLDSLDSTYLPTAKDYGGPRGNKRWRIPLNAEERNTLIHISRFRMIKQQIPSAFQLPHHIKDSVFTKLSEPIYIAPASQFLVLSFEHCTDSTSPTISRLQQRSTFSPELWLCHGPYRKYVESEVPSRIPKRCCHIAGDKIVVGGADGISIFGLSQSSLILQSFLSPANDMWGRKIVVSECGRFIAVYGVSGTVYVYSLCEIKYGGIGMPGGQSKPTHQPSFDSKETSINGYTFEQRQRKCYRKEMESAWYGVIEESVCTSNSEHIMDKKDTQWMATQGRSLVDSQDESSMEESERENGDLYKSYDSPGTSSQDDDIKHVDADKTNSRFNKEEESKQDHQNESFPPFTQCSNMTSSPFVPFSPIHPLVFPAYSLLCKIENTAMCSRKVPLHVFFTSSPSSLSSIPFITIVSQSNDIIIHWLGFFFEMHAMSLTESERLTHLHHWTQFDEERWRQWIHRDVCLGDFSLGIKMIREVFTLGVRENYTPLYDFEYPIKPSKHSPSSASFPLSYDNIQGLIMFSDGQHDSLMIRPCGMVIARMRETFRRMLTWVLNERKMRSSHSHHLPSASDLLTPAPTYGTSRSAKILAGSPHSISSASIQMMGMRNSSHQSFLSSAKIISGNNSSFHHQPSSRSIASSGQLFSTPIQRIASGGPNIATSFSPFHLPSSVLGNSFSKTTTMKLSSSSSSSSKQFNSSFNSARYMGITSFKKSPAQFAIHPHLPMLCAFINRQLFLIHTSCLDSDLHPHLLLSLPVDFSESSSSSKLHASLSISGIYFSPSGRFLIAVITRSNINSLVCWRVCGSDRRSVVPLLKKWMEESVYDDQEMHMGKGGGMWLEREQKAMECLKMNSIIETYVKSRRPRHRRHRAFVPQYHIDNIHSHHHRDHGNGGFYPPAPFPLKYEDVRNEKKRQKLRQIDEYLTSLPSSTSMHYYRSLETSLSVPFYWWEHLPIGEEKKFHLDFLPFSTSSYSFAFDELFIYSDTRNIYFMSISDGTILSEYPFTDSNVTKIQCDPRGSCVLIEAEEEFYIFSRTQAEDPLYLSHSISPLNKFQTKLCSFARYDNILAQAALDSVPSSVLTNLDQTLYPSLFWGSGVTIGRGIQEEDGEYSGIGACGGKECWGMVT